MAYRERQGSRAQQLSLNCQGHCQWAGGANQKLPSSSRLVSKSTCALVAWTRIGRGQAAQLAVTGQQQWGVPGCHPLHLDATMGKRVRKQTAEIHT